MRVYQLYASVSASADNAATLIIARKGKIKSVQWSIVAANNLAVGDMLRAELSLQSTSQFGVNDASGIISRAGSSAYVVTSGGVPQVNVCHLVGCDVEPGVQLRLHIAESGTSTWAIYALVCVDD